MFDEAAIDKFLEKATEDISIPRLIIWIIVTLIFGTGMNMIAKENPSTWGLTFVYLPYFLYSTASIYKKKSTNTSDDPKI